MPAQISVPWKTTHHVHPEDTGRQRPRRNHRDHDDRTTRTTGRMQTKTATTMSTPTITSTRTTSTTTSSTTARTKGSQTHHHHHHHHHHHQVTLKLETGHRCHSQYHYPDVLTELGVHTEEREASYCVAQVGSEAFRISRTTRTEPRGRIGRQILGYMNFFLMHWASPKDTAAAGLAFLYNFGSKKRCTTGCRTAASTLCGVPCGF